MTVTTIQTAFNAGEISPELYGEVSLAKYSSALTTCRNAIISYRGGALSRGGTAFVGRCRQSVSGTGPPRPIPFQFSNNQGYVLEFGDQYMRIVYQGGYVLENPVSVTGATPGATTTLNVTGTPYSAGDWVYASGFTGGWAALNGNTYLVVSAPSGSVQINDLNNAPVDSSGFGAYAGGGELSRIYTLTTPYSAVDLPYLKFSQTADVMSLTCSNPVTGNEYPPYDLTRLSAIDWTLAATNFSPVVAAPTSAWASSNATAPSSGVNASFAYVVTAVDSKGNESVASNIATCHGADIQVEAGSNTVTWWPVEGAIYYNVYRAPVSIDTGTGSSATQNPVPAGSIFGFVGSSYSARYVDNNTTPDLSKTPPTHQNPFARGRILAVNITDPGDNLSGVNYSITTSTGSGFVANAFLSYQFLGGMQIVNPGQNYHPGDSIAFNGAGYASGAIDSGGTNATSGQTVNLNGVVFTFESSITGANQVLIGGSLGTTLNNLVAALSSSQNAALTVASYAVDSTGQNLLITYNTAGTEGNTYTLSAGSPWTTSGSTLTGGAGTAGGVAPSGTLVVGPNTGTYPGVNAYFQQRHFFACSLNNPDTLWASQTGLYTNFDTSIPTVATDSITASPWTEQVNGIQWLIPMPGGLIAMTGLRAWQVIGEGSYQLNVQPITPSTTQAQPQAFNGCSATIPPIVIDYDVLYVQAIGDTTVYDLSWNFWVNIYTGNDLTILSSHLFRPRKIVQWAWARQPYKVLWASCDDGTLLSLTYLKEQNVYGWARHDTQGLVVGICSVTEPPVNAVYAIVQRFPPYAPQGVYIMERLDDRLWRTVEDTYAVDSGVSYPIETPAASLMASANSGSGVTFTASAAEFSAASVGDILRMCGGIAQITGYTDAQHVTGDWILPASNGAPGFPFAAAGDWSLATPVTSLNAPHLAGMSVVGLADGVPIGPITVGSSGAIALPFSASNVKVGLPFTVQMQTPYLNGDGVVQGARKAIPAVTARVAASSSFTIGTNQPDGAAQNPPQLAPQWSNMAPANTLMATGGQTPPATYQNPAGQTVTQLWTGDIRVVGEGAGWNSKGQVAIQQTLPLPLEIISIQPEVLPGDLPDVQIRPQQQGQDQTTGRPGKWMIGPRL